MSEENKLAVAISIGERVRELLSDERRWTQYTFARLANDEPLNDYNAEDAVCWCLQGAIYHINDNDNALDRNARHLLFSKLESITHYGDVSDFNDSIFTTHADVLNALDEALTSLRSGGVSGE
jgi:hypothetical protein